jgi:Thioredoxin domain-containing protein
MLQLSNEDFLGFNIQNPGVVLIYFKQTGCGGCLKFDPVFLQIERKKVQHGLQNVIFATINISSNPQVIRKASDSNISIDRTPLLIIFHQTTPYAKYHGPLDEENIFVFIKRVVSENIMSAQSTVNWRPLPEIATPASQHMIKPSYMGGLRKGTSNVNKDQLYAEDLTEGFFDNWKSPTPKDKSWLNDINRIM